MTTYVGIIMSKYVSKEVSEQTPTYTTFKLKVRLRCLLHLVAFSN